VAHDDAELLERWRQGDRGAGRALFERYYPPVLRFFRNKVDGDAADLVQETFRACVERRDNIRSGLSLRAYLFGIAHNLLRGYLRTKYLVGRPEDLERVALAALTPGPSSLLVKKEEERLLLEALRSVPVDDQVILELRFWESLKTREIAEILEVPHPTVRSRLRRAQDRLAAELARLAAGPLLESTLTGLEQWAARCKVAAGE
jgi:RNA polymerase sigma-70 factor (ECF subfamily)